MPKITLLGELAFRGILCSTPEKNSERFKEISSLLHPDDFVFANLVAPLKVGEEVNKYKNLIVCSDYQPSKDLLKLLNIKCVSLASNHIYDCMMSGLKATINLLDELGIYHTGAGWESRHVEPVILRVGNEKIAFMAYVDKSTNPKTEPFSELLINYFEIDKIKEEIKRLPPDINKIICSIHWGDDYLYYPSPLQVSQARYLIEQGVSVVFGHHPHVLQPYEIHGNGVIFYSLGNLISGDFFGPNRKELRSLPRKTKRGVIVTLDENLKNPRFITTREKEFNYIELSGKNFKAWSKRRWVLYRIINSCAFLKAIYLLGERVHRRVAQYFFGYYCNPFKKILSLFSVIKKARFIFDKNIIKEYEE